MKKRSTTLLLVLLAFLFLAASCKNEIKHEHKFVQKHDESGHWTECACGEKTKVEAHDLNTWKLNEEIHKEERGCSKCEFKEYRLFKVTDEVMTKAIGYMAKDAHDTPLSSSIDYKSFVFPEEGQWKGKKVTECNQSTTHDSVTGLINVWQFKIGEDVYVLEPEKERGAILINKNGNLLTDKTEIGLVNAVIDYIGPKSANLQESIDMIKFNYVKVLDEEDGGYHIERTDIVDNSGEVVIASETGVTKDSDNKIVLQYSLSGKPNAEFISLDFNSDIKCDQFVVDGIEYDQSSVEQYYKDQQKS